MRDDIPALDTALRRLAQERDAAAWAAILERAGPGMLRLARRIAGDDAGSDDAVQEALLLIRDHAGQFRGDGDAAARGWIMRVTASAALQLLRRARRRQRHEAEGGAAPAARARAPGDALEHDDHALLLRRALAGLPERQRLPLTLRYFSELDLPAIAVALGLPLGTVKTHLHRGLAQLRARLGRAGVALSAAALVSQLQALEPAAATTAGLPAGAQALLRHPGSASCAFPATASSFSGLLMIAAWAMGLLGLTLGLVLATTHPAPPLRLGDTPPPASAAPPAMPPPADIGGLSVAILGDLQRAADLRAIGERLRVIHGPHIAPAARIDAIEIVTDVDLGPGLDHFAVIDGAVDLARGAGLGLFLRVKPRPAGTFATAVCRETRGGETDRYHPSAQVSFCDPAYVAAVEAYFRALARKYAGEPVVLGLGIGICPSGETQYPTEGTGFGDFSAVALADWQAWMARSGRTVTTWPALPPQVVSDSRIAQEGDYYLWALWRAEKLGAVISRMGAAIHAVAPRLQVGVFSYAEIANPAGYVPGFSEDDPHLGWTFGGISLDHGFFAKRDQDRSRPVAVPGKPKAVEFDLISAYTDPAHMETFARYLWMMGGQPRPFLPTWWSPGKGGGWAEGFSTGYSDELARRMCAVVNANRHLRGTSVADVAFIAPTISGMGSMASWGPWSPEEWRRTHTDVVRQLQAVGANFDILAEDGLTAARLKRYRLVVVASPALYPWVRDALHAAGAHVLTLGWAGMISAPDPGHPATTSSWSTQTASWWPTGGMVVKRPLRVRFGADPLLGPLARQERAYAHPERAVAYVRGLRGDVLASDDEGQAVMVVGSFATGRRLYHLGLPLMQRDAGQLISDDEFRALLTNVLRDAGCTAYGELGPLRLFENSGWLLVENPNGTSGTVAAPAGAWSGVLRHDLLKHPPQRAALDGEGRLALTIPAGGSVVVPLAP